MDNAITITKMNGENGGPPYYYEEPRNSGGPSWQEIALVSAAVIAGVVVLKHLIEEPDEEVEVEVGIEIIRKVVVIM